MGRWIRFFLMIAIGAALGLFYAWRISPVEYVGIGPEMLRVDYRADYVLMTAEVYSQDGDLEAAVESLAFFQSGSPGEAVLQAILFAEEHGYDPQDLTLMRTLAADLGSYRPAETPTP